MTQFFYPTMFGWITVSFLYFTWTALYLFAVLVDLFKIVSGKRNDSAIFIDFSDTVFFLVYTAFVTVIFLGLLKAKPKSEKS